MNKGVGKLDDNQDNQDQGAPVTAATGLQDAQANDVSSSNDSTDTASGSTDNDQLLEIKRSALQDLSPLLDSLDQEPEDRFQTTMMMIQATDNKELVAKAYEAAKQIKEDKERAQALLDIVNEINYFTQNKD